MNGSWMKVESIAECSPWSILQYFWPALSDNWAWKHFFFFLRVAVLDRFYCIKHLQCVIALYSKSDICVLYTKLHRYTDGNVHWAQDKPLSPQHQKYLFTGSKFPKSWTFETSILKLAVCPLNIHNFNFTGHLSLDKLYINRKTHYILPNSAFWDWLSMESQLQNPEFRNNPENFHPCLLYLKSPHVLTLVDQAPRL